MNAFIHGLGEIVAFLLLVDREVYGIGDEVRVLLDDLPEHPLVRVVADAVVGIDRQELEGDRRAGVVAFGGF